MPGEAGIGAVTIAGLPERLGIVPSVKLSPADGYLVAICRVDGNRGLVCRVSNDVVSTCIDVYLITYEWSEPRDHSRRTLQPVNVRARTNRHFVFFERLREAARGRRLT